MKHYFGTGNAKNDGQLDFFPLLLGIGERSCEWKGLPPCVQQREMLAMHFPTTCQTIPRHRREAGEPPIKWRPHPLVGISTCAMVQLNWRLRRRMARWRSHGDGFILTRLLWHSSEGPFYCPAMRVISPAHSTLVLGFVGPNFLVTAYFLQREVQEYHWNGKPWEVAFGKAQNLSGVCAVFFVFFRKIMIMIIQF